MDELMFNRGAAVFSSNSKRSACRRWIGIGNIWHDFVRSRGRSTLWLTLPARSSLQSGRLCWPRSDPTGNRDVTDERQRHEVLNEIWRLLFFKKTVDTVTRFHLKPCSSLTSPWLFRSIFFFPGDIWRLQAILRRYFLTLPCLCVWYWI